jgi:hypothetical protein
MLQGELSYTVSRKAFSLNVLLSSGVFEPSKAVRAAPTLRLRSKMCPPPG